MKHIIMLMVFAKCALTTCYSISDFALQTNKYYVVSKPITLADNDTLRIPAGTEILFAPFSGITVLPGAALISSGTKEEPVYYTSLQDTAGTASAFDWIGIDVKTAASASLSYCVIAFSTTGITAEDSTNIRIDNCIFSGNGQWSVSLSGIITQIPDLQPFSYQTTASPPSGNRLTLSDNVNINKVPQSPILSTRSPKNTTKKLVKLSNVVLFGVGIITTTATGISIYKANTYSSDYNAYVPGTPGYDNASATSRQSHFDDLRKKHNTAKIASFAGLGVTLLDIAALGITIAF
jgi:hypothetical protein